MINLLDPEQQRQLKAARLNVKLRRFVVLSSVVVLGVGVVYGVGFWLARSERAVAEANHQTAEQELSKYATTVTDAATYRQNLATAKQILGNEMVFSTFLTDLGSLMPQGTILDSINLSTDQASSQNKGAVTLATRAKSYDSVLKIKQAFEGSSLFSDVRILNTSVGDKTGASGNALTYPYTATFELVVNALKGSAK